MAWYRAARNDICNAAMIAKDPLAERYAKVTDPAASETERADALEALKELVVLNDGVADQLASIDVPPEFVAEHATYLAQFQDVTTLIEEVVALLEAGNLADAGGRSRATQPDQPPDRSVGVPGTEYLPLTGRGGGAIYQWPWWYAGC